MVAHHPCSSPAARKSSRRGAKPQVRSNETLTQFRLVLEGAGLGVLSGYLAAPELLKGSMVRLLPDCASAPIELSMIFPTPRELAPAVRAFVDFMVEVTTPAVHWRSDLATD